MATTIKKPNQYFDAVLWTGNGANRNITGVNFSPDLVIGQARNALYGNWCYDTVRGATKQIEPFGTNAESTQSTMVTAFNSDGFSLGTDTAGNDSGINFVAWLWRGSDSAAVVNTSGTISSNVSVNTTAGFSVVTYTGTGANATVGHGLGVAPKLVILKARSAAYGWNVWHTAIAGTQYLNLFNNNAVATAADAWNSQTPTSTVFSLGTNGGLNENGTTFVVYCWSEVEGYSKFGSYTGNGSTDGAFVYTGFKPKFVLIKRTNSTGSWVLFDGARNTYNVTNNTLYPDLASAEESGVMLIDFVSNGFKLRSSAVNEINASGSTYIYAAFAESPFKYSNAK